MKKCPYCAEEIQEEAVKCRHCHETLSAQKKIPAKQANVDYNSAFFTVAGLLFLIVIISSALINTPNKEYYPSGTLKRETFNTGQVKEYYESGKLQSEGFSRDGKKEGPVKGYYENGELKFQMFFKNDKIQGVMKSYYENGALKSQSLFENGHPAGVLIEYDENGMIKQSAV